MSSDNNGSVVNCVYCVASAAAVACASACAGVNI